MAGWLAYGGWDLGTTVYATYFLWKHLVRSQVKLFNECSGKLKPYLFIIEFLLIYIRLFQHLISKLLTMELGCLEVSMIQQHGWRLVSQMNIKGF